METLGIIYILVGVGYVVYVFFRYGTSELPFFAADGLGLILLFLTLFVVVAIWPVCLILEVFGRNEFKSQTKINLSRREQKGNGSDHPIGSGLAITDFMPSGRFKMDGGVFEGRCSSGIIRKGTRLVVVGKDGFQFLVVPEDERG